MGTRSIIARAKGDGWEGTYHHWDGYPSGVGKTLHQIYQKFFAGDAEAMLAFLIDEHPAGWSTINGTDFSKPAGYVAYDDPMYATYLYDEEGGGFRANPHKQLPPPQCFCHGSRSEDIDMRRTSEDAKENCNLYEEYLYVIAPAIGIMEIWDTHGTYNADPATYRPTIMTTIRLDDPLMDDETWQTIDRALDAPETEEVA